jgi:hypothetical protein
VNDEVAPGHLKRGKMKKKSDIDTSNILQAQRPRQRVRCDVNDESDQRTAGEEVSVGDVDMGVDVDTEIEGSELQCDQPERYIVTGKPCKKLIKGDIVSTLSKNFDGTVPGSYSAGKPERVHGRVLSRSKKGGNVKVKWDDNGEAYSIHWTHLHLEMPKMSVETILAILGDTAELKIEPPRRSMWSMAN